MHRGGGHQPRGGCAAVRTKIAGKERIVQNGDYYAARMIFNILIHEY